jgi:hypothetical protein
MVISASLVEVIGNAKGTSADTDRHLCALTSE